MNWRIPMFDPAGYVLCEREFNHTEFPDPLPSLNGMIDLEERYKQALAGQLVQVMEVSKQEDEYLVLGRPKKYREFLWMVDIRDTRGPLLPVVVKHGVVMPAGLSAVEEFKYLAELKINEAL